MQVNDIGDLHGSEGYRGIDFENYGKTATITLQSQRNRLAAYPRYGSRTDHAHDYRGREIRDLPQFDLKVSLLVERRRLRCPRCGIFTEDLSWPGRGLD